MLYKILYDPMIVLLVIFFFLFFSLVFILFYSRCVCLKLKMVQPDFFQEKNYCYYMTEKDPTQFIYYILYNYHKKIIDPIVRKKCNRLRNFAYFVIFLAILLVLFGMWWGYTDSKKTWYGISYNYKVSIGRIDSLSAT